MHQSKEVGLFSDMKTCSVCGRRLPESFEGQVCPGCEKMQLLREVKDYIRENDVNEYQVADKFKIPVRMVKEWIREGRIEYRVNVNQAKLTGLKCQKCGASISFGTLCTKCLKGINKSSKGYGVAFDKKDGKSEKMHFLDKD